MGSMQKARKETALKIITIFMIATLFLSAIFASRIIDHDCTGEDCSICQVFQIAKSNLQSIVLKAYNFTKQIKYTLSFLILFPATTFLPFLTLVTEKIKLND